MSPRSDAAIVGAYAERFSLREQARELHASLARSSDDFVALLDLATRRGSRITASELAPIQRLAAREIYLAVFGEGLGFGDYESAPGAADELARICLERGTPATPEEIAARTLTLPEGAIA